MNGFISYAKDDHGMCQAFARHLGSSGDHGGAKFWWDDSLRGGHDWERKITDAIEHAEVFVLLVSSAFLASVFIRETEERLIRERAARCDGLIVSVILKSCYWEPRLGRYQVLPSFRGRLKPIHKWGARDEAYDEAHRQLLAAIREHLAARRGGGA